MGVFENDNDAFLRYTLADSLSPNLVLRLFQSGPGTFWTNLGDKNLNLMLPVPSTNPDIFALTAGDDGVAALTVNRPVAKNHVLLQVSSGAAPWPEKTLLAMLKRTQSGTRTQGAIDVRCI